MRACALVLALFAVASCGGGSPTSPSSNIPSVAGSYSGTATLVLPESQLTINCPATTSVTQSGAVINLAPIILGGNCGNSSIPFGQTTIDATGALNSAGSSGTFNDPSCGTHTYTGSGGFFGREFRLSLTATSPTCEDFNFTAVLDR